jgi:hypothetical protein
VNGSAALVATAIGSRNFFPSEVTSQPVAVGDPKPFGLNSTLGVPD